MKSEHKPGKKLALKNIRIVPELQGKYKNQPLIKRKAEEANRIIEKFGVPNFESNDRGKNHP